MPLLDLGYRSWEGNRTPRILRWTVVALTGITMVWRGYWLRSMFVIALTPALFSVLGFFMFEQGIKQPEPRRFVARIVQQQFKSPELAKSLTDDPDAARHDVWAQFLMWFFRYPQAFSMVVVFGLVAPRLISYDLRSRAYLLYLSRPMTPFEYLVGKGAVLWFLLTLIATLPALFVYFCGVLLSPQWQVIEQTWDLPLRVLLATIALALPTSAAAICYSSMTTESRFAGFAWFATWVVGWVTYAVLTSTEMFDPSDSQTLVSKWQFISPYHTLGQLQAISFGISNDQDPFWFPVIASVLVTLIGFFVAYRRIAGVLKA